MICCLWMNEGGGTSLCQWFEGKLLYSKNFKYKARDDAEIEMLGIPVITTQGAPRPERLKTCQ